MKTTFKSAFAAILAGSSVSLATYMQTGNSKGLGTVAIAGGLVGLLGYLTKSPIQQAPPAAIEAPKPTA